MTETERMKVIDVLKQAGFSRPDPGPAFPARSGRAASSYEEVFLRKFRGELIDTLEELFRIGCLAGPYYDGTSDYIYIDVITGETSYVVSSQNGGIVDFFIYGGRPVSFELVRALAEASGNSEFRDISESNWIAKLPEVAQKRRTELLKK